MLSLLEGSELTSLFNKVMERGQTKSKWFFQVKVSSKKWMNKFYFTTMTPQVDLFLFIFREKLKAPKRHFKINWSLRMMTYQGTFFHWKQEILGWSLLAWQLSFISSHITAQGFQYFFPADDFAKCKYYYFCISGLYSGISYVCMHAQNLLDSDIHFVSILSPWMQWE